MQPALSLTCSRRWNGDKDIFQMKEQNFFCLSCSRGRVKGEGLIKMLHLCTFTIFCQQIKPTLSFFFYADPQNNVVGDHCCLPALYSKHLNILNRSCSLAHHVPPERPNNRSVFLNQASLVALWEVKRCWRCVVHSSVSRLGWDIFRKGPICAHIERGGIITKQAADCSHTKAALTSSLLVVSRVWSHSLLTLLTPLTQTVTPERQDHLFHNKTRNWLLSAPVNWT